MVAVPVPVDRVVLVVRYVSLVSCAFADSEAASSLHIPVTTALGRGLGRANLGSTRVGLEVERAVLC